MEFETKNLEVKKFIPEYISVMYESWGTDKEVGKYASHLGDINLNTCCQGNHHSIPKINLAHLPPLPAATSLSK